MTNEERNAIGKKLLNTMTKLGNELLQDKPEDGNVDTKIVASLPCTREEAHLIAISTTIAGMFASTMSSDEKMQLLTLELGMLMMTPNIDAKMIRLTMKTHRLLATASGE